MMGMTLSASMGVTYNFVLAGDGYLTYILHLEILFIYYSVKFMKKICSEFVLFGDAWK